MFEPIESPKGSGLENIICVTNRHIAAEAAGCAEADGPEGRAAFLAQLRRVAARKPKAVILREKDLAEEDYRVLAKDVLAICRAAQVPCILHTFVDVAEELGADGLHLPLSVLRAWHRQQSDVAGLHGRFHRLGASCHSALDVREAAALGCTYVTVGHIYATACKKGLPPRGLALLRDCAEASPVPVYAIGGLTRARVPEVLAAGAAGACVMSGLMTPDFADLWQA